MKMKKFSCDWCESFIAYTKLKLDFLPAFISASIEISKINILLLSIGISSKPIEFNLKAH